MNNMRCHLLSDYSVSRVIKGGWQMSAGHAVGKKVDNQRLVEDTLAFIRGGITTLDFGDIYLGVEELVGEVLKKLENEAGKEARDAVQLHTKYVPDLLTLPHLTYADVERIIDRSRERLGIESLDLVQFHWWDYGKRGYVEVMLHLRKLQQEGKIRLLGVTNFDVPHVRELVDAGIAPSTIQLQYSVLDHRPKHEMTDFCQKHGISLLCYGTVAGGFLSETYLGVPEPNPPFKNRSLTKYKLIIDEFGGWTTFQKLLRVLDDIAKKYGCGISCVASAYILAKPQVASVIVGAHDRSHLQANLTIIKVQLTEEDIDAIESVTHQSNGPKGEVYGLERNDPKHAGIMHTANNAMQTLKNQ